MKLSVVMPIYNERTTLRQVVEMVLAVGLETELICVDDGSTDGSREILEQLQETTPGNPRGAAAQQYWARGPHFGAEFRKPREIS
jgi:glycosyltransferase involved in cell wall biosynthesis